MGAGWTELPLGFSASEEYRQVTAKFGVGDRFLFYSDGVTEACNPAGESYGEERLHAWLCRYASRIAYLAKLGLAEQLPAWSDLARQQLSLEPAQH